MFPRKVSDQTKRQLDHYLTPKAEIRRHYWLEKYVIMAPKRSFRPDSFKQAKSIHKSEAKGSPALEREPSLMEITDAQGKWQVKIVNNAFPALTLDNPASYGRHEIVIETPYHNRELSELPLAQIERVFDAYIQRTTYLRGIKGIKYVSVFKNDGPLAGASIAHAHSQIIALPLIPPAMASEAAQIESYRGEHGTCPACDSIVWEQQQKMRVIFENDLMIAIAPYAGSSPFGAWLLPKRHVGDLSELNTHERHALALFLQKITSKLDKNKISFNYFVHNSLANYHHHFILKVEPRPNIWAGLELATGVVINPVLPETSAKWYREN